MGNSMIVHFFFSGGCGGRRVVAIFPWMGYHQVNLLGYVKIRVSRTFSGDEMGIVASGV
jgi:hypothetical protein